MYETLNGKDFDFLKEEDRELLQRITAYSGEVLGDVDPQKVPISQQLEALKPVMEELAAERSLPLEDIFIKYMDLASLVLAKKDQKFREDMQDLDTMELN